MPKSRKQKENTVSQLTHAFKDMKSVVFTNFDKLTVNQADRLRKECRDSGVTLLVAKKTLLKKGLKDAGFTDLSQHDFEGGVASVFSIDDETAGARIIKKFSKESEGLSILGGIFDRVYLDATHVQKIASLPGKEQLLGQLVGTIAAPLQKVLFAFTNNPVRLVTVLLNFKNTK